MNTNLQKDCEYNIELGDSFSNPSLNEFHSLVYKFKPKSLKDNSWEGKIDIDTSSTIVHLNASSRLFKGTFESYKKPNIHECILIYDKNSNTFTLEKLHATIGALQQIADSSSNNLQNLTSNGNGTNGGIGSSGGGGIMTMPTMNLITETIVPSSTMRSNLSSNSINTINGNSGSNGTSSSSSTQLLNNNSKTTPPKRSLTPSSSTHSLDLELPKKKLKDSPPTFTPSNLMNINNTMINNNNTMNSMNMNNNSNGMNNVVEMKPMGLRTSEIDSKDALDSDSSGSDVDSDSSDSDSSDSDSDSSDSSDSDSS